MSAIHHMSEKVLTGFAFRSCPAVRDFLRFKVVVSCVLDAFFFIDLLVSSPDWKVVKFDIEK